MRKRFAVSMLAIPLVAMCGLYTQNVSAVSSNIVISQIQTADLESAKHEFIELYNNSDDNVDITNWCLYYASASSVEIGSKMACFLVDNQTLHLMMPGHSFVFVASNQLATITTTIGSDLAFAATLSGTGGHVRLIDSDKVEIDKVGWGDGAVSAETKPAAAPLAGSVLQRRLDLDQALIDTDNNYSDFEIQTPKESYIYGELYEVQDSCLNIDGIQLSAPDDYTVDTAGNCYPPPVDVCPNIDGMQLVLPEGYTLDTNGDCIDMDICPNLDGVQLLLPPSYVLASDGKCMLDLLPLKITEMLPNAVGDDRGREFIELYNPNDVTVDLTYYQLAIGLNHDKQYAFTDGVKVAPNSYLVLSNDDINFQLVNTSSQVALMSADGSLIDAAEAYVDPADGLSWALIDDIWQYTNQPTPGVSNLASVVPEKQEVVKATTELAPCAPNQYRSEETNRCRQIVIAGSTLTPCKVGQYRSEETNRCRSIASDVAALAPCAAGEERNPETNRCRAVLGAATELAPCAVGEERNPDTNRCRKVVSTIPTVGFAVEPIADKASDMAGWWAFGGVSTLALGYAGWEWRTEALHLIRKVGSFFRSSK